MVVVLFLACGGGGGGPQAQTPSSPSSQCTGSRSAPSLSEYHTLLSNPTSGPHAWLEAKVTRVESVLTDNHLLLDGVEIPIVRVKTVKPESSATMDPSAGQLIGRNTPKRGFESEYRHVVTFRIPLGTQPGKHALSFKTCDVAAPESITIDVAPSPAPVVTSIHFARGEQFYVLTIKGSNLSDAEEVLLVDGNDAVSSFPTVTKVDDSQIRATVDAAGTYEVFVRTKSGLGGGPPSGVVTIR